MATKVSSLLLTLLSIINPVISSPQINLSSLFSDVTSVYTVVTSALGNSPNTTIISSASSNSTVTTAAIGPSTVSDLSSLYSTTADYSSKASPASSITVPQTTSAFPGVTSTSSSAAHPASTTSSASAVPSSHSLSRGAYAGISIGVVLGVITAMVMIYFLVRRHLLKIRNRHTIPQPQNDLEFPSEGRHGGLGLENGQGKDYIVVTTVQQDPELQKPSSHHGTQGIGPSIPLIGLLTTNSQHELHEQCSSYQRNGAPDTTTYDEKNGSADDWGGGPGAPRDSQFEAVHEETQGPTLFKGQ